MEIVLVKTEIGEYELHFEADILHKVCVTDKTSASKNSNLPPIAKAFLQYFQDPRIKFEGKIAPAPTKFQQKLRALLQSTKPGQTLTYGEAAKALNTSPRAIGNACRANPLPIIVPCHRIVASNGLGGYAGQTQGTMLNRKSWLLNHENGVKS